MQTNNLFSCVASEDSLTIRAADGSVTARITDMRVAFATSVPQRPVELVHLAQIAEQFHNYHRLATGLHGYDLFNLPFVDE